MTTQPITARPTVPTEITAAALTTPLAASVAARTLIRRLLVIAFILIPSSFVTNYAQMKLPDFFARDLLANTFSLGSEANLPSAFSAIILWTAGALLWAIGRARKVQLDRYAGVWLGLSAVFAYLGLDEFAQLHDRTVPILRTLLGSHATGGLKYTWILLFGPLTLIVFLATIPFLRNLRAKTRNGMLLAGAIYLGGALGLEIVKGVVDEAYGFDSVPMLSLITVSESMEIFGVILFIATLLSYWREDLPGYRLLVGLREHDRA
ncbi:hypothetical protein [Deinococcus sp.]|uniref:hypothetical protein n=1 Tax=Deinococcus sp. TaxID=47478 RepID=UPI002869B3A4|nr:hypothetical protein [Deinococcus sp.]